MQIKRHKQFVKDFKKNRLTDGQFDKLITYLNALKKGQTLPAESKDHALVGNFSDCREFHLGGDLLVIYLIQNKEITLLRLGTHAQLFT